VVTARNKPPKYGVEDLDSFADRSTRLECDSSQHPLRRCDGGFNGRSEAADSHGQRVRVLIPANPSRERSGGIKFACGGVVLTQDGEASGLILRFIVPPRLHWYVNNRS